MSGLTRRRAGGNEASSPNGEYEDERAYTSNGQVSHENSGGEDFEFQADEDGFSSQELDNKKAKLTLMEEVLLLALRDEQGYYSWWNENMSYVLRGCILMELSMRKRIASFKEAGGKHHRKPYSERLIDVIDDSQTGEVLLDEALKLMKMEQSTGKRHSAADWVDLLSGETWNVMKFSFQLKLVRERLSKGLVDKGVLRTEKKNFLVFEMTTHPVADATVKGEIVNRLVDLLLNRGTQPTRRTIALACAACAANVLENALNALPSYSGTSMSYSQKDACFAKCEEMLVEWSGSKYAEKAAQGDQNLGDLMFKENQEKVKIGWNDVMTGCVGVFLKMDSML